MTALVLMGASTFADQFDPPRLDRLRSLVTTTDPLRVDDLDDLADDQLAEVEILITGWGAPVLDESRLSRLPRLRALIHCAGSVRSLVSPELWRRGICVSSAAEVNAIPVAEFTFAAVVMAGKKAPFLAADASRAGGWGDRERFGRLGNLGLCVGVVGFSKVGRRVVERLQQLQDVRCLVADPYVSPSEVRGAGAEPVDLISLLGQVDVLTVHAPDLPSTYHLIGAAELAALRDHATLINTARGRLVDTEALTKECASGRLNAILDVTDPEPLPSGSILPTLANVMVTPHVAGSLGGEIRRMTDLALDELACLSTGGSLQHAVLEADLAVIA